MCYVVWLAIRLLYFILGLCVGGLDRVVVWVCLGIVQVIFYQLILKNLHLFVNGH